MTPYIPGASSREGLWVLLAIKTRHHGCRRLMPARYGVRRSSSAVIWFWRALQCDQVIDSIDSHASNTEGVQVCINSSVEKIFPSFRQTTLGGYNLTVLLKSFEPNAGAHGGVSSV
jgi:hypothetical protein